MECHRANRGVPVDVRDLEHYDPRARGIKLVGDVLLGRIPRAVPEIPLVRKRSIAAGSSVREGDILANLNRRGTRGEVRGGDNEEEVAIYEIWS